MTLLVAILFVVMAGFALASAATGAGIVVGLVEDRALNRALQRIFFAEAVAFCVLGCAVILGTGA